MSNINSTRVKEILLSNESNFDHPIHGIVEVLSFDGAKGFHCITTDESRVYCQPEDLIEFSKSKWIIRNES